MLSSHLHYSTMSSHARQGCAPSKSAGVLHIFNRTSTRITNTHIHNVRPFPSHKPAVWRSALVRNPSDPRNGCVQSTQPTTAMIQNLTFLQESSLAPVPPPEVPTARAPPTRRWHCCDARQCACTDRVEHEEGGPLEDGNAD
jgi:hypothetical protein